MTWVMAISAMAGAWLLAYSAAVAGPADMRASPFPAGVTSSGWIGFDFYRGSRIFIPARINGVPAQIMLDSGASQTVLDARFVKTLRVKGTGHFTGQGAGGSAAYEVLHGVNIELGAINFRDTASVGIDLAAVEKQLGHELPVVLGGDAFAHCVVDIDFARHRIAFRNPAGFPIPPGAASMAVSKAGENFAIRANVEGRPASLVFDIGNASALNLYPSFWERPDFLGSRPVSTTQNGGLGGMHVYKLATIKSIDVAGSRFSGVPVVLWAKQKDVQADGNIGLPLLERFHLLVDLPHSRVLFAAPVDTVSAFNANHTGLTLAPDAAGARILYVAPGSPADGAGLKSGDVIVALDAMKIADWEARRGLQNWIYGEPGARLRVGLASGKVLPLTLAAYF